MFIPVIRVFLFHSLRCLVTLTLLAVPWVTASRCFGQEPPPQTQEQRQAREALNKGVQDFKNGQYDEATQDFLRETAGSKTLECQAVSGNGARVAVHSGRAERR